MKSKSLHIKLDQTQEKLKSILDMQDDVVFKELYIPGYDRSGIFVFVNGTMDYPAFNEIVLDLSSAQIEKSYPVSVEQLVISKICSVKDDEIETYEKAKEHIFDGKTLLFIDGIAKGYVLNLEREKTRNFTEPSTERVVRGPKMGFIESLKENIGLIRQYSSHPNLVIKQQKVGTLEKRELALIYYEGKASDRLIKEVNKRIDGVKETDLQDSGMLEELIEDTSFTPFPQIQNTERPDKVLSALQEGRVVIMIDGSPFALMAPTTITMLLQSPDDYYERWVAGTFLRILRYFSLFVTVFLSGIYISLVSFNPGLLPTELAMTIAGTRENVPFPPFVEAIIMELTIELLREAGIRLPAPIGQTVGLVGGVIIGQAAVQANIVSSLMVIIVAITTITSFTVPQYSFGLAFRALRFGAMIFSAVLGLYGTTLFFILVINHLSKLTSFQEPYFQPLDFIGKKTWKDAFIRLPKRKKGGRLS
ncbi:spore germination protein [Bacillus sp. mrc49]|uniref:spore germination protein n=1 Tax=Bacillus sp. mrc49 TaxID=2054913 RepID=UPI000C27FB6D|nr:spore germination protein [Bacillus sp. mrc49]PJN88752.1 spore germination protein [Bacillus sp. mrc49]